MSISFENPKAFYALFLLIPAVLYMTAKYNGFVRIFSRKNKIKCSSSYYERAGKCFVLRSLFRCFAWVFLVFAVAGISWGQKAVPVQKNGKAVTFVFDISYSMNAKDGPGGKSRFECVADYTNELLDHMSGVTVASVIAKGTGIVAVPQTQDIEAVKSLLTSLSPKLISTEGTSLGSGINAAIASFPSQSSEANYIWIFTDGEETDNSLQTSLYQAVSFGIPVTIVGFGSERESEVLAGDGITSVKTALRAENIKNIVNEVNKKNAIQGRLKNFESVTYIDASEPGSAYSLIKQLFSFSNTGINDSDSIKYEIQSVSRYQLFIVIALILFIMSFFAGEFTITNHRKLFKIFLSSIVVPVTLTGCSGRFDSRMKVLSGHIDWKQNNYQDAVADFLTVINDGEKQNDMELLDYGLFGLATTYMKQNEEDAAIARFEQISPDCSESIKFSVYYNCGLIAASKGDYKKASEMFKKALVIDQSNINAKINLELCLSMQDVQTDAKEQELKTVKINDDDSALENAIYSIIRENEQNQWKNQQQSTESSALDY